VYLAVCDDDPEALERLGGLLEQWRRERRVPLSVRTFSTGEALLAAAPRARFTLYVLAQLSTARAVRALDGDAKLVFLAASPAFACASYEVKASEYLLKPVDRTRLFALLDRVLQGERRPRECLLLRSGGALIRIPYVLLSHVEVRDKHLFFHQTDGQVHKIAGSLKDYQDLLLARPEFLRIHRSYIVNLFQLREFSAARAVTLAGCELPVSRLLYPHLQRQYQARLSNDGAIP